ncbi:MAG: hypothetical protein KJZ47_01080 [Gemmatimonadales bacterium]|nr:hypothetical protein [Gemmatimonadales bacterium]
MWRYRSIFLLVAVGCQSAPAPVTSDLPQAGASAATDTRDQLLLASTRIALPPPGIAPGDLPEPNSAGAVLVKTHCAQCHDLPTPAMHSATDWPGVVRRMWLRMDRLPSEFSVAIPDQGARNTMLTYLTANALQVSGATLPAGEGRETFAVICSRCHALPDPKIHSAQDWLAVFLRMEQNMTRMNVSQATPAETQQILGYLQAVSGAP